MAASGCEGRVLRAASAIMLRQDHAAFEAEGREARPRTRGRVDAGVRTRAGAGAHRPRSLAVTPGGSAPPGRCGCVSGTRSHSSPWPTARPPRCGRRPRRTRPASRSACVAVRAEDQLSRARRPPPRSPPGGRCRGPRRRSCAIPCSATNRRTSAWFGACGVWRRDGVVQGDGEAVGEHARCSCPGSEGACDGGGVIVAETHVGPGVDDLARAAVRQPGRTGQRFLGKGECSAPSSAFTEPWSRLAQTLRRSLVRCAVAGATGRRPLAHGAAGCPRRPGSAFARRPAP